MDRAAPLPLWYQVREDLRRRVAAGEFPDRLPTEAQLAAGYRVSRHTIREALRRLRESGALVSTRGIGTSVDPARFEQRVGALYSLFRLVEDQGAEQRSEVLELARVRQPEVAARLLLPPDEPLVYLERLRFADGEPLAHDRAWLPYPVAAPVMEADFSHTALYDELTWRCGVRPDGGTESVRAVLPDSELRRLLCLSSTVAVLLVERLATWGGRPVEWRTTVVRGDRYRLTLDWHPESGVRVDAGRLAAPGYRSGARAGFRG